MTEQAKSKSKKNYSYDYPENRELAEGLIYGDYEAISKITGFSNRYVAQVFRGERKMIPSLRECALGLCELNRKRAIFLANFKKSIR